MKKRIISYTILVLFIFSMNGCQKDEELVDVNFTALENSPHDNFHLSNDQKNLIIDELAQIVAVSLKEENVRIFLHDEIAKQFDLDYDILYSLIKNKQVVTKQYGLIEFGDYLQKLAKSHNIDITNLNLYADSFKNLQISSPVYFEDWKAPLVSPMVISLPVSYHANEGVFVNSYRLLEKNQVLENEIKEPILLVRESERVNSKGMMRVDKFGFVLLEEDQTFSAVKAYEYAADLLKSEAFVEPVIEIIDDESFNQVIAMKRVEFIEKAPIVIDNLEDSEYKGPYLDNLKSAQAISAPTNIKVFPDAAYSIRITWKGVADADAYEIWRQHSYYSNQRIITLDKNQSTYLNQNLSNGTSYYYSVRAVDASGIGSPLSEAYEGKASWRTRYSRDVIEKIYISKDCWNWCCGLFDGKIELQYKVAYYNHTYSYASGFPSSGVSDFGQKKKSDQKDKWCTYNRSLFSWNVQNHAYNYQIKLIEDDGNGTGVTVKIGVSFKIPIKKIEFVPSAGVEFKIANSDEEFTEEEVLHWDPKGEMSIGCKKGSAKIFLKQ